MPWYRTSSWSTCVFMFMICPCNLCCSDINECSLGSDGCADTCTNMDGAFECGCPTGYTLGADFRECMGK